MDFAECFQRHDHILADLKCSSPAAFAEAMINLRKVSGFMGITRNHREINLDFEVQE